jgi:hypothetical protein
MTTRCLAVLVTLVALARPSLAPAQTVVINPTTVIFNASADHTRVLTVGGQQVPMLTNYVLRIMLEGASQPIVSVDLGKPAPNAAGEIRATPAELIGLPLGAYVARVAAVGPGGMSESDPTAPFARAPAPAAPTGVRLTGS